MEKIQKSILVDAPSARTFKYLTDPFNLLEIWPSLPEISNVDLRTDGSYSFDWTYRTAGLRFHPGGDHAVERNRRRVVENQGGIPST